MSIHQKLVERGQVDFPSRKKSWGHFMQTVPWVRSTVMTTQGLLVCSPTWLTPSSLVLTLTTTSPPASSIPQAPCGLRVFSETSSCLENILYQHPLFSALRFRERGSGTIPSTGRPASLTLHSIIPITGSRAFSVAMVIQQKMAWPSYKHQTTQAFSTLRSRTGTTALRNPSCVCTSSYLTGVRTLH